MKTHILAAFIFLFAAPVFAQTAVLSGIIKDITSDEPLTGATVSLEHQTTKLKVGTAADGDGKFFLSPADTGRYTLQALLAGYNSFQTDIVISGDTAIVISLRPDATEAEEMVITGTRTAKSIADVAVRVEVIPQEEVEEKILMKPSSVSMLLSESTGMRVQTTSGTSNTSNLRIQGLQGRYTQLLVDGVPNFGGLSSGFGLTQLAPLNLRQVEIVKGAGSVLYGGDAIAGVVNFITKNPKPQPEASAILNTTTQRGLDLAGFYSQQFDKLGVTVLAASNTQPLTDVDGDGFSDVSEYTRFNLTPKLVYNFSEAVRGSFTFGVLSEERLGGTVSAPRSAIGTDAPYLEQNKSLRLNMSGALTLELPNAQSIAVKLAAMRLTRDAFYGATPFDATQTQVYADAQYAATSGAHALLFGSVFTLDDFADRTPVVKPRSYALSTAGVFAQDEFTVSPQFKILASSRMDLQNEFGLFFTPRLSLMWRPANALTVRFGGGTGYKIPTIFVEEAEEIGFRGASQQPKDFDAERSQSLSVDANYKILFGEIAATFNAALYLTRLENALITDEDSLRAGRTFLENATGETLTRGGELSTQLSFDAFKLSLGYTYIFAEQTHEEKRYEIELNPRHSVGIVLVWESEASQIKAGLETYYTSSQRIDRTPFRTRTPEYWVTGALIEKGIGRVRFFINFENIFDTRQTRFDPIVLGDPQSGNIETLHIYAPLEGRVINGGIRFVF